ncbi:penicillin-binding protein 2 [Streptomyces sp. LX-29]|uniref:penicillin-binding transpeptidase domain-containing protein n=1 Tax=Streptomyces sp. LX-29 TaxID=2900152 RepID=UPI00240CF751|nr:penicillin-binding transpeptidase domain-containing protein [Streptomyces sp. LX-29]WFB07429.1 penicillin-binding protein 2 [Streptomyces sp. LX-29]
MTRYIRRTSVFCLLLLLALLVNAGRIQAFTARSYDHNPANRRPTIARYDHPRGDILIGRTTARRPDGLPGRRTEWQPITGSRDTGQRLRYERTYADGPLYAPVTGFSSQIYGTSLVERAADAVLSGADPRLAPFPLWNRLTRARPPGGDVRTTIDPAVQRAAFAALGRKKGAIAAIEPATGRILALVSTPSYDPGTLSGTGADVLRHWARLNADAGRPMLNRAIRQTYPPGSAFKVVTAAAALEYETVTDIDARTDSPDPYRLPGTLTRLGNHTGGCEDASLRRAFARSCNTVFARVGARTGLDAMATTAEDFGFNDASLTIPSRVAKSTFATEMDTAQLALSSIGQYETRATPLQMAMVAAAVAAGGDLMRPYLVDRVTTAGGTPLATARPRLLRQPMSPRTAAQLRRMMISAVTDGTGAAAALPGATVGGKTGTAQHGVGNAGMPYAWFIGWARADGAPQPAVATAVVVEDAAARRDDISGARAAAPVARAVLRAALGDAPPLGARR